MRGFFPTDDPLKLSPVVVLEIQTHAKEMWPEECCGVVTQGKYIRCDNKAEDRKNAFLIDPVMSAAADAVIHSHCMPFHHWEPTADDMAGQIRFAKPWGIVHCTSSWASKPLWFGDFRLSDPLEGRKFVYGVYDCYSLIRAYYWQRCGLKLRDYPRDRSTVMTDTLYASNFSSAGFQQLGGMEELQVGDGLLMQMAGQITHHGGIWLGDGQILHHLWDNLSKCSPYYGYEGFVRYKVRHENNRLTRLAS